MHIYNLGDNITLCKGETLILDVTTPNSTYLWQDNSTKPIYTVSKAGSYQVRIKNTCESISNKLVVKYHSCNCNIYMPNAFTPNSDGINDKFPPLFDCDFYEYNLKNFNRWGERIFETNSYNIQWDGTFKGIAQPTGVYVFLFAYKLEKGEKKINNGTILLIR